MQIKTRSRVTEDGSIVFEDDEMGRGPQMDPPYFSIRTISQDDNQFGFGHYTAEVVSNASEQCIYNLFLGELKRAGFTVTGNQYAFVAKNMYLVVRFNIRQNSSGLIPRKSDETLLAIDARVNRFAPVWATTIATICWLVFAFSIPFVKTEAAGMVQCVLFIVSFVYGIWAYFSKQLGFSLHVTQLIERLERCLTEATKPSEVLD